MPDILDRISLPEDEWAISVRPLDSADSQREFIHETGALLSRLTLAARAHQNPVHHVASQTFSAKLRQPRRTL